MNSKEYKMMQNKSALQAERLNLQEALDGLDYILEKDSYQNSYLPSWTRGTPAAIVARIAGLLGQQSLLQEQTQEES